VHVSRRTIQTGWTSLCRSLGQCCVRLRFGATSPPLSLSLSRRTHTKSTWRVSSVFFTILPASLRDSERRGRTMNMTEARH